MDKKLFKLYIDGVIEIRYRNLFDELVQINQGEGIRLDSQLPNNLQEILDKIPKHVPIGWRIQARKAVFFIFSLDMGVELFDESGKSLRRERDIFVQQLASSNFVLNVIDIPPIFGVINPEQSLPTWLFNSIPKEARQSDDLERMLLKKACEKYQLEVGAITKKIGGEENFNGQMIQIYDDNICNPSLETHVRSKYVKGYIDQPDHNAIKKIPDILKILQKLKLHPKRTKVFDENTLVLYWNQGLTDQEKTTIISIFNAYNVPFRSFAEDVQCLIVEEDGKIKTKLKKSNDGALGTQINPDLAWEENEYNQQLFIEKYLAICLDGCKDPSQPYKPSFIQIIVRNRLLPNFQELIRKQTQQINEVDLLPALVSEDTFLRLI